MPRVKTRSLLAVVAAALIVVAGFFVYSTVVPRSASANEQSQIAKAAKDAVETEGNAPRWDPSWPIDGLSKEHKDQLRARITHDFAQVFTGDLLAAQLSGTLGWLEPASQGDAPRVVEFRIEQFVVGSVTVTGGTNAELKATYRTYFKNAQVATDKKTDQIRAGWANYVGTFQLQLIGNKWLVSGMSVLETAEEVDPNFAQPTDSEPLPGAPEPSKSFGHPIPVTP
jgi:hypothetical protein